MSEPVAKRSQVLAVLAERFRFARALRMPPFALIWAGQSFSTLGDGVYIVAIIWQVNVLTHSASAIGFLLVANSIAVLATILFGGVIADRLPKRLTLLISDIGRGLICVLIAWLTLSHQVQYWHLVLISFLFGLLNGIFVPTYRAFVPTLVPDKSDLQAANSINALGRQIAGVLGPTVGATLLILPFSGTGGAYVFDGVTFFVSAACFFALRLPFFGGVRFTAPQKPKGIEAATEAKTASARPMRTVAGVWNDIREGWVYVLGVRWLWISIAIAAVTNVGLYSTLQVAWPTLVSQVYKSGPELFALLLTATTVGGIASSFLAGHFDQVHRRGLVLYYTTAVCAVAILIMGLPLPHVIEPVVAIMCSFLFGCSLGFNGIIWVTLMQEKVPADKLGRASAVDTLGSLSMRPLGLALLGFLTTWFGPSWVLVGAAGVDLAMVGVALSVPDIRNLD